MSGKKKKSTKSSEGNSIVLQEIDGNSDSGEKLLSHMEAYVKLVRKVNEKDLINRFLESLVGDPIPALHEDVDDERNLSDASRRLRIFIETTLLTDVIQHRLENASERINLLCDDSGSQIVSSLLNLSDAYEKYLSCNGVGRFSRALYLFLDQEYPTSESLGHRRFEFAESKQSLVHQASQVQTSCLFMGPKGIVPRFDEGIRKKMIDRLSSLYPQVKKDDVVIETYKTFDVKESEKLVDLVTWTVTFNGKHERFQFVSNGTIEEIEQSTASYIRFNWSVSRGTLAVFCEDFEHSSELAKLFLDIGFGDSVDTSDVSIWEFDLTGFARSEILTRLKTLRIDGIEGMDIRSLTLCKPEIKSFHMNGREINRRVENALVIKRHRYEERDIYEVARKHHRLSDFSGYVVSQVKLGIRMAKTKSRSAHSVSVQMSRPNGFSQECHTKEDSALILKQLMLVGCARQI